MGPAAKEAKLPLRQLTILAICRFAEPVALTSVFPYLPEMIESFGIRTDRVARWAGIGSAAFSVCQCFTAIIWGQMSDRFGRKYFVLASLTMTMITSILFGLSTSLPWMIVARCLGGAGAGTVGIIRTMVAEMVPQRELQPRAFSIMPLVWTIGSVVGPSFGGALADPVRRYPKLFGSSWLLLHYPYVLPNLVSSILFLIGLTTGILFLRETLESKKSRKDYGLILGGVLTSCRTKRPNPWQPEDEAEPFLGEGESSLLENPKRAQAAYKRPRYSEVLSPQSNINLLVYTLLAMHSQAYDQLLPIFMHHPLQDTNNHDVRLPFKFAGGFGLNSDKIGVLFTMYGVMGMIIQFLAFPPLAKRYGVLNCLRLVSLIFPFVYILTPFTSLMPTVFGKQAVMVLLMLVKCWAGIFAFPCSTILLTNSAASLNILGTLNGIATSTSAMGRAVGPFLGGSTFTFGVGIGYVVFPWWILAVIAMLSAIPVYFLKEMEGFSAITDDNEEEDEEYLPPLTPRHGSKQNEFVTEEDVLEEDNERLQKPSRSRPSRRMSAIERRMSSPIGMGNLGPPIARRFSNNLGATRSGFGVGTGVANQG